MRWGIRKQQAAPAAQAQRVVQEEEDRGVERRSKSRTLSFSPLSWLAKVTGKDKPCASAKPAPASTSKTSGGVAPPFPSCLPKRTSPSPVTMATAGQRQPCSPPRRSPADDVVAPRRLSVGNDNGDAVSVRRHRQRRRRHCSSLGGDGELPPLGRLIPFSLAGSPARSAAAAVAPSDTSDAAARARRRQRRRNRTRRVSVSGGRRSTSTSSPFSGRVMMPPRRVRVRSPRRGGVVVESPLAVVRRTRDPQRAFRESMVEMMASTSGGAEEVERLLACYLSLNADEHHDCIVKVFRQVWFEYVSLLLRPDAPGGRRRAPARS
ncbi:hypothetical protein HU200_026737 [Digitaria exilis]|uniref:Transcription repressor n=1 Tax=Digitaria exilis TaxID=1010633 RepID=A0A835BZH7_9POAL|nr:hypothetical protein HU200_026737 [Digitaria exilis]